MRHFVTRIGHLIAVLILGLAVTAWVVQAEYRHASIQLGSSVPAIPALAVLLLMVAGLRIRKRVSQDSRKAAAAVYLALVIAAAIPSTPSLVYLFGQMTAAQVQADRQGMKAVLERIPTWAAPPPGPVIRGFYDGSRSGGVPWRDWAVPLTAWGLFLCTLMATLAAALSLLRRSWMEHERLSYPMVQIPLRIVNGGGGGSRSAGALFWTGFGLTACLDGLNMLHAFSPSVPALGAGYDIGLWFPSRPWSSLSPMWVSYRPEIFGLAYLMPMDVLLTAWLSYVALRLSTVTRVALGSQIASTAYDYQEIGMGAFLCLFVLLILRAMPQLRSSLQFALRGQGEEEHDEPIRARLAWAVVLGGPLLMVLWLHAVGLPIWLAIAHLTLLLAVAIVYARIRCETGTPSIYLFPFWQQQSLLTNLLGSQPLMGAGGRGLVGMALVGGLSRGVFPELSAYAAEGMSLAAQTGMRQRTAMRRFLIGTAAGLGFGAALYLGVCYAMGADNIGGGYQLGLMRRQFQTVAGQIASSSPTAWRPDLVLETAVGALLALAMNWARQRALWFPLHPVGFAMASAYGYHLWFPFLTAWILKGLILRFGGHSAYARFIPLFLGIAMGRYLFTGVVWGLLGLTGHPAVQSYQIHFS